MVVKTFISKCWEFAKKSRVTVYVSLANLISGSISTYFNNFWEDFA